MNAAVRSAIRPLISTWLLHRRGYVTGDEADAIDGIYDHNPMLADLILHRTLRSPDTNDRFPASVFETAQVFERPKT